MSRFMVVPAAYVLLRRGVTAAGTGAASGELLMNLRSGTGYRDGHWATAAAGHIEHGESAVEAAIREAHEELGVTISPDDLVPLCAMHRTNGPEPIEQRVDLFFECRRWSGEPERREPHKSADLRWFPLSALPEPTVPHERYLYGLLERGAVPPVLTFGFCA